MEKNTEIEKKVVTEFEDFEVIEPCSHRLTQEVLSVMDNGIIAANPALLKHFLDYSAEIRLKKDCTEILLLRDGEKRLS